MEATTVVSSARIAASARFELSNADGDSVRAAPATAPIVNKFAALGLDEDDDDESGEDDL